MSMTKIHKISKVIITFLSTVFFTYNVWSCPTCAGMPSSQSDKYTAYILCVFILLAYIPFVIIFRLIRKWRHLSLITDES